MPLDQHIESRHSVCQPRLKICPTPMHHLLQMADERQHREDCLHEHTVLPRTALTHFEIRGIALGSMEAGITQDNHLLLILPNQRPRSWDRPLYAFRGGRRGAGASSTDAKIAVNIERGF